MLSAARGDSASPAANALRASITVVPWQWTTTGTDWERLGKDAAASPSPTMRVGFQSDQGPGRPVARHQAAEYRPGLAVGTCHTDSWPWKPAGRVAPGASSVV